MSSSEPIPSYTVIQCPKCRTCFRVPDDHIRRIETPRFHCSKCDELFRLEEAGKPTLLNRSAETAQPPLRKPEKETEVIETDLSAETLRRSPIPERPFPSSSFQPPPSESQQVQLSLDSANLKSANLKGESRESVLASERPDSFSTDDPLESLRASQTDQEPVLATERITSLAAHQEQLFEDQDLFTPEAPNKPGTDTELGSHRRDLFDGDLFGGLPEETTATPQPASTASFAKTSLTVAAPLVLFLLILGLTGKFLSSGSSTSKWLASLFFSQQYQAAPAEVRLVRSTFKRLGAGSGDRRYAILGKMKNSSPHALQHVILEGVVFDRTGQDITTKQVALYPISNRELESLTPEVIDKIQGTPPNIRILPGEEKRFAIVFEPREIQHAEYFTARVFSAMH